MYMNHGGGLHHNQHTSLIAIECFGDMNERGRQQRGIGYRREDGLLCPQPRRLPHGLSSPPDILKPARRLRSSLPSEGDAGGEILDILLRKGDPCSPGSSHPYFNGSPPSRVSNPLIHDAQFTQRMVLSPPVTSPLRSTRGSPFGSNQSCKKSSCSTSHVANPLVRVEGFLSTG